MSVLDWCVLAVLLASIALGLGRGLIYEVLSLLSWVAAALLARMFAAEAAVHLPLGALQGSVRYAAGFVVVFVLSAFVCGWVAWLGRQLVEAVGLRPVDRTLGALFGAVRGTLLLLVATMVMEWLQLQQQPWWQESLSMPWLSMAVQAVAPAVPADLLRNISW